MKKNSIKIYESCLEIVTDRGSYTIPASKKAAIYGLENGDVLIKSKSGRVLKGSGKFRGFCEEIRAQKGKDSLWPGELFKHDFKKGSKAAVLCLDNGDVIIRSLSNKKLWKHFKY